MENNKVAKIKTEIELSILFLLINRIKYLIFINQIDCEMNIVLKY